MSQYTASKRITLDMVIKAAREDCEERKKNGQTMTASYFIEDAGEKFVVTVTPASQIQLIMDGRRSTQ